MRNQYFGDVNDYRKYGLLRILASAAQLRVGVCWLLTADDDGGDGEFRQYLQKPHQWRHYDPALYDCLQRLLAPGTRRSVAHAQSWELVPGATYFEPLLADARVAREQYFTAAWRALADCDLVFLDPDNGIEVPSTPMGTRGSCKYVYWHELTHAYGMSKSILVYQHYPRVVREAFVPFLAGRLAEELGAPAVVAFRTPYVAFFLVAQDRHRAVLQAVHDAVAKRWPYQIDPGP